ncbi:hypothetical protein KUCAC02_022277 [Chaenocephalus aceratus]|nr:hypothetical protein KUCAC02_022277 [Chaenocephalus aceratus]
MKEDEGGGKGETDKRECRFTHYTVTSGLLSAMIIFSNLYFLVPLCILGLVYSLIGRTLWLRPQSSRRDQSHRHTIKMLGEKHTPTLHRCVHSLCNARPLTKTELPWETEFGSDLRLSSGMQLYLNLVSSVLFYLSAAINPLLYNFMSARYHDI